MHRRDFVRACSLVGAAASLPELVSQALAQGEARPRLYGRARLVDAGGRPVKSKSLPVGQNLIFHYPYAGTPCFLLNLGKPTRHGGAPRDRRQAQLRVVRRHRRERRHRRVLGDLRAPPDLPHARHQLHQLPRRQDARQPPCAGHPLLLRAQPVRPVGRRPRRRRTRAATARRDPARLRPLRRRAVRGRHAGRRGVRRVLRQVRVPPRARARRQGEGGGRGHVRGERARALLPAAGEVLRP